MIIAYYVISGKGSFYNSKIDIKYKNDVLKLFKFNGYIKRECINNIEIISSNNDIIFKKVKDIYYKISDDFIFVKQEINTIAPFNYNNVDFQEKYAEYKTTINNIDILCKVYDNYLTICYKPINADIELQKLKNNLIDINNIILNNYLLK